jgi:hypothetical protein
VLSQVFALRLELCLKDLLALERARELGRLGFRGHQSSALALFVLQLLLLAAQRLELPLPPTAFVLLGASQRGIMQPMLERINACARTSYARCQLPQLQGALRQCLQLSR